MLEHEDPLGQDNRTAKSLCLYGYGTLAHQPRPRVSDSTLNTVGLAALQDRGEHVKA
jgi:hypothetical protein